MSRPRFDGADASAARPVAVTLWLAAIALAIVLMSLVGAATRLTNSGLSITEWQPILGAVPPLNGSDWTAAFERYQLIPQFKLLNATMTLDEFKAIYWWEWAHRFIGRMIAALILLPMAWFWWRGTIAGVLVRRGFGLFGLVAVQGAIGWYMVKSGLVDRTDVSQYRLALHLAFAVLTLAVAVWLTLDHGAVDRRAGTGLTDPRRAGSGLMVRLAGGFAAAVYMQVILGAFVAGLDAGKIANTWPTMDGEFVPQGLLIATPWWVNLFENALTAQFNHRMAAYLVVVFSIAILVLANRRRQELEAIRLSATLIAGWVLAQTAIGIATVVQATPISLALLHQAGALILIVLAVWQLHRAVRGGQADPRLNVPRLRHGASALRLQQGKVPWAD